MNTAYKWYSHNSNIIQFYSGYASSQSLYSEEDYAAHDKSYEYITDVLKYEQETGTD